MPEFVVTATDKGASAMFTRLRNRRYRTFTRCTGWISGHRSCALHVGHLGPCVSEYGNR